ncbi:DUF817 family protein [Streptomyces laurentii]|uniref:DUF817 family protein n=1 Tax=Streptomyces laurentii TaxID=39478 RepID=UPI003F4D391B
MTVRPCRCAPHRQGLAPLGRRRVAAYAKRAGLVVIAVRHVVGPAFEPVKVSLGSWSHPEPAVLKFAGVPLYGGFLYAAAGSYVCQAWHLLGLEPVRYGPRAMALVAAAVYADFFTHHWLPDMRWPLVPP